MLKSNEKEKVGNMVWGYIMWVLNVILEILYII